MLKAISWSQYGLFLGLACIAWYLGILVMSLTKRKVTKTPVIKAVDRSALIATVSQPEEEGASNKETPTTAAPAKINHWQTLAETVIEEVRDTLSEGTEEGIGDEEMKARLNVVLANYPELQVSAFGLTVDEFVLREGRMVGYEWSEEEVAAFWK